MSIKIEFHEVKDGRPKGAKKDCPGAVISSECGRYTKEWATVYDIVAFAERELQALKRNGGAS